jgi:hypothetical protein
MLLVLAPLGAAAEPVGKAVKISTTVVGNKVVLKRLDPVSRNDRIETNAVGLGQFLFDDGTKFAVGPNSSVVIDEYVLGSDGKVAKLTLNATRGVFRWVSGSSPSSAYKIVTPLGALGVRGTAVDLHVAPEQGQTTVVLIKGAAQFCIAGKVCRELTRACEYVVAAGKRNISEPQPITSAAVAQAGREKAFPFLLDNSRLLPSLRLGRSNCNMNRSLSTPRSEGPKNSGDRGGGGGRGGGGEGGIQ